MTARTRYADLLAALRTHGTKAANLLYDASECDRQRAEVKAKEMDKLVTQGQKPTPAEDIARRHPMVIELARQADDLRRQAALAQVEYDATQRELVILLHDDELERLENQKARTGLL